MRNFIKDGIPPALRGEFWQLLVGSKLLKNNANFVFQVCILMIVTETLIYLSFIDPPLGGFDEILPEVMVFLGGFTPR